jgi:lysophospholipase L1-like esterase
VDTVKRVSPGTRIYLQSTLPVNREIRDTGRDNGRVAQLNALLAELAARDDRVEWIDVGRALADPDGNLDSAYTYDGVHLNGAGYARWKAVILPYLQGTSVAAR